MTQVLFNQQRPQRLTIARLSRYESVVLTTSASHMGPIALALHVTHVCATVQ